MTEEIIELLIYKYPHKFELNRCRLNRLMYLIDWAYTKRYKKQLTNLSWSYTEEGPVSLGVWETIKDSPKFSLQEKENMYGDKYHIVGLSKPGSVKSKLHKKVKIIINQVIRNTKGLSTYDFIYYYHQTDPLRKTNIYGTINLEDFIE